MDYLLMADVEAPMSALAGWITAGTSIGLLGPVLYWLCYVHLPSKDAQIAAMIDRNDTVQRQEREAHRSELQMVITHCEKEKVETEARFSERLDRLERLWGTRP